MYISSKPARIIIAIPKSIKLLPNIIFFIMLFLHNFRFACSIKFILFAFKLAGGEQHFMLFADGKSTRDSRFSGARGCSHLDGTK